MKTKPRRTISRSRRKALYEPAETQNIIKDHILRKKLYGKNPRFDVQVATREEYPKGVIKVTPGKKRLTKEEKLALSRKLAGSADRFSAEGIKETIRIANREYEQEDES